MTTSTPSLGGPLPGAATTEQGKGRSARLAERVSRLRTRATTGNLHIWLLVAGGVLMPLGFMFILLGWLGASRTPLPFEQTSYLISGGIFGLALVVAGGFVYFAYWETVRIRESREQSQTLTAAILRLESALQAGLSAAGKLVAQGRPSSPSWLRQGCDGAPHGAHRACGFHRTRLSSSPSHNRLPSYRPAWMSSWHLSQTGMVFLLMFSVGLLPFLYGILGGPETLAWAVGAILYWLVLSALWSVVHGILVVTLYHYATDSEAAFGFNWQALNHPWIR